MLQPKLSIYQKPTDCSCIYIKDITGAYSSTNLGGYGSPNIELSDVVKTVVKLDLSDNIWSWEGYLPTIEGYYRLCATTMEVTGGMQVLPGFATFCGCNFATQETTTIGITSLPNGCGKVTYEIYTLLPYAQTTCSYYCEIPGNAYDPNAGDKAYSYIDGVLTDISAFIEGGDPYIFGATSTHVYTGWIIKNSSGVIVASGDMTVSNCYTTTITPTEPVLSATHTFRLPIVCNLQKGLVSAGIKLAMDNCKDCLQNDVFERDLRLHTLARSYFESLDSLVCDCDCLNTAIARVQNIVNDLNDDCA